MDNITHIYEPYVAKNQKKYVLDCLESNMLTFRGKYVSLFEQKLAEYLKVNHVVTTFNGSVSLYLMMQCLCIKSGDEVITSSLTYAATVSQINLLGAKAVFVDSDDHLQMLVSQVEKSITKRTKAILVPELYADIPNDILVLRDLCEERGIFLLEDSAESFACTKGGKQAGSFGKASSISFFSNKVITCSEGGCVATNDDDLAEKMNLFKNQSHIGGFMHNGPGTNFRMTNIQAAIGLAQLEDIDLILKKKQKIAQYYRKNLSKEYTSIVPAGVDFSSEWMPVFQFTKNRITYTKFMDGCRSLGIETRPIFTPVHLMSGFNWSSKFDLSNSESVYKNKFNLPCYPSLTKIQLEYIVSSVNRLIEKPI